jgi:hypothetical protein
MQYVQTYCTYSIMQMFAFIFPKPLRNALILEECLRKFLEFYHNR